MFSRGSPAKRERASAAPQIPGMFGGMDHRMTALERAFQLARSGEVAGLPDIRKALKREGYYEYQIEGPTLTRQLADLIKTAHRQLISPPKA
jgi:hypothetical protein